MDEMKPKKKMGGARPGAGRPKNVIRRKHVKLLLSQEEHELLSKLGGSRWLRTAIREAAESMNEHDLKK